MFHFKNGNLDIHGIPSIVPRRAIVTAKVPKVEEIAPSCNGSIREELGRIAEPDVIFEDDDED